VFLLLQKNYIESFFGLYDFFRKPKMPVEDKIII
jgi:hypothetical protein